MGQLSGVTEPSAFWDRIHICDKPVERCPKETERRISLDQANRASNDLLPLNSHEVLEIPLLEETLVLLADGTTSTVSQKRIGTDFLKHPDLKGYDCGQFGQRANTVFDIAHTQISFISLGRGAFDPASEKSGHQMEGAVEFLMDVPLPVPLKAEGERVANAGML